MEQPSLRDTKTCDVTSSTNTNNVLESATTAVNVTGPVTSTTRTPTPTQGDELSTPTFSELDEYHTASSAISNSGRYGDTYNKNKRKLSAKSNIASSNNNYNSSHRSSINYDALYDEEEDTSISMEAHGSMITHLLSQVKIGMDLTKVVLPTFILEKRSLLEMYADYFAHPDLFLR